LLELVSKLREEFLGGWRFRWQALGIAWMVALIGWLGVSLIPNQYGASARIYVDSTSRLDQVIERVTIQGDASSELQRVRQALLGRPTLERVVSATGMDLRAKTVEEREALIERLQTQVEVRELDPGGRGFRDNLFSIRYQDRERTMALAVVESLLEFFVNDVQQGQQSGSAEAELFLMQQIAEYESQLTQREQTLAEFKRQWVGLLPGDTGDYYSRLQAGLSELQNLESELVVARDRRAALRRQLGLDPDTDTTIRDWASISPSETDSDLDARIAELESSLGDLLLRYTDRHPDSVAVREQLDQLRAQRTLALESLRSAETIDSAAFNGNAVYENIQIMLNGVNVELAALQSQVRDRRAYVEGLRGKVNEIPQVEAELAQLTRDYAQVQEIYDELRSRLERERLRTAADVLEDVKFQVIDPPSASYFPLSPNRALLTFLCLVASLGAGVGFAYLRNRLHPVFSSVRTLRQGLGGLPVLGAVSRVVPPYERVIGRLGMTVFGVGALSLLMASGAVFYLGETIGASVRTVVGLQ